MGTDFGTTATNQEPSQEISSKLSPIKIQTAANQLKISPSLPKFVLPLTTLGSIQIREQIFNPGACQETKACDKFAFAAPSAVRLRKDDPSSLLELVIARFAGSQPETLIPCFFSSSQLVTTGSGEPKRTKGGCSAYWFCYCHIFLRPSWAAWNSIAFVLLCFYWFVGSTLLALYLPLA